MRRKYAKDKASVLAYKKEWRKKNPSKHFSHKIWTKYKISKARFDEILIQQSGRCAICTVPLMAKLHIDHDHKTGAVRGLLCDHCNHGIGRFRDNPQFLIQAAAYLG